MPAFDVEFEVYCNTCGDGLCGDSQVANTRNRNALSVRVNACPSCMEKKDDEITELQGQLTAVEKERDEFMDEVDQLKSELEELKKVFTV